MPEIILKKFVVSILIGIACVVVGLIWMITYTDIKMFVLSIVISIGMGVKAGLVYYRYKTDKYLKVKGTVVSVDRKLLASHKTVELETEDGINKLYIPKDTKVKQGNSYCFYFVKDTGKSPVIVNEYITSKLNTDNFVGCEEIKDY